MGDEDASLIRANHRVALPMTDLALEVCHSRTMFNAHTTWDATALVVGAFSSSSLLLTLPEIRMIFPLTLDGWHQSFDKGFHG